MKGFKTAGKALVFAISAALITSAGAMAPEGQSYEDVSSSAWYFDAVTRTTDAGLMAGTGENRFDPEPYATRAMAATTLYRLEDSPPMGQGKSGTFTDVPESQWYTDAAEWAAMAEITFGYDAAFALFGPQNPVSREQLVSMLYRYARYKGLDTAVSEEDTLAAYADAGSVSEYARLPLEWAVEKGLIAGRESDSLNPRDGTTRAELATLLMRFADWQAQE